MEQILRDSLSTVGVALLSLLSTYIIFYINKATAKIKTETAKIQDEKQKALIDNSLDRINELTKKAVIATNEVTARELKFAIQNGSGDKSELIALGEKVANEVYGQLSEQVINYAKLEITDVKGYIMNEIENQVKLLK